MEIKDRIRMIIDSHKLTAGAFADRIGVQRSNVSHVLSGRNKPSFEFLEKVLLGFPKVQAHWLLTGKQSPAEENTISYHSVVKDEPLVQYRMKTTIQETKTAEKKVIKIVTFYSDFTFDTYLPNEQ